MLHRAHGFPDAHSYPSPLFAAVSIALIGSAGYLGIANGRRVRATQRETLLNAGPVIQQLYAIKFSGLRIISAATDYGLFRLEDPVRNAARMHDEENEIVAATSDLNSSLDQIRVVWERAGWDRAEIADMQRASERIKALGVGLRSDGARGTVDCAAASGFRSRGTRFRGHCRSHHGGAAADSPGTERRDDRGNRPYE
jgi:hypothetical protein